MQFKTDMYQTRRCILIMRIRPSKKTQHHNITTSKLTCLLCALLGNTFITAPQIKFGPVRKMDRCPFFSSYSFLSVIRSFFEGRKQPRSDFCARWQIVRDLIPNPRTFFTSLDAICRFFKISCYPLGAVLRGLPPECRLFTVPVSRNFLIIFIY